VLEKIVYNNGFFERKKHYLPIISLLISLIYISFIHSLISFNQYVTLLAILFVEQFVYSLVSYIVGFEL